MRAKTKFKKMYHKLPIEARKELVYNYAVSPMSLNVCYFEINEDTVVGRVILEDLGYEDD